MPVRTTTPRAEPSRTIVPISAHDSLVVDRIRGLLDRHRLAGEHRLVALELDRLEQPHVGRHDVADRQLHDVARYELDDVDALRHAVAHDERGVPDLRVQRLDRLLGSELVHEPEPDRQARRSRR